MLKQIYINSTCGTEEPELPLSFSADDITPAFIEKLKEPFKDISREELLHRMEESLHRGTLRDLAELELSYELFCLKLSAEELEQISEEKLKILFEGVRHE